MTKKLKGDEISCDILRRIETLEAEVKRLTDERQTALERRTYAERQARGEVR